MNPPLLFVNARNQAITIILLVGSLLQSCGGGSDGAATPPEHSAPPSGYVLKQYRIDAQTLSFALERTADEPLLGLSFDLVFPHGVSGIAVVDKSTGALTAGGTVGVAADVAEPRRIVVAAGKAGSDSVRGVGELLRFRLEFASAVPVNVVPQLQSLRFFRGASTGEFADEVTGTMPFSVVAAP